MHRRQEIRLKHETSFGQAPGELIAYELRPQESGDELESSCVCSLARALEFGLMILCVGRLVRTRKLPERTT